MRKIGAVLVCAFFSTHCTREGCPTGFIPSGSMCVPLADTGSVVSDAGVDAHAVDAFVPPDATPCGAQLQCMGMCVDQLTDRDNCGACGVRCDLLQGCNMGTCNQPVALLQSPENDAVVAVANSPNGLLRCVAGNAHASSTWTDGARSVPLASPVSGLVECTLSDGSVIASIRTQTGPTVSSPADGEEGIHDIALASGKTYIVGAARGTFQLQGSAAVNSAMGLDGFIARTHPDGMFDNLFMLTGPGDSSVEAIDTDEVVGTSTTVCYGGWFTPFTQFDTPISTVPNAGGRDAFVSCKINEGTALNWWFGAAGDDAVTGIAVVDGYVYVVGHLSGPVINGATAPYLGSNAGGDDAFLLRISLATNQPDFGVVWGSTGADSATDVVADAARIAITGHCAGAIAGALPSCADNQDGFLVLLDATAPTTTLAAQLLQSPFADAYESVALGTSIFATGHIGAAASAGALSIPHAGADGTRDVVVARYMLNGSPIEAFSWGSAANETGNAIAATASDVISVGGTFDGTASIAGTPVVSMGASDGFLVRR